MAKKHRHSAAEIATKLEEADVLLAEGRTQTELARALGISVMTFHRWRKATPRTQSSATAASAPRQTVANLTGTHDFGRVTTLQLENARLRKLVIDLLLEKMKLEEESTPARAPINKASG